MNYAIMENNDINREMAVTLYKSENKYTVTLSANTMIADRKFEKMETTFGLFVEMSRLFAYGLYAMNDRFEIFKEWSVEK